MKDKTVFYKDVAASYEVSLLFYLNKAKEARKGAHFSTAYNYESSAARSASIYTACKLIISEETEAEELMMEPAERAEKEGMNKIDGLIDERLTTETGRELLRTLLLATPEIVFSLASDANKHRDIGWTERYDELMDLSKKICKLAQATGKIEGL